MASMFDGVRAGRRAGRGFGGRWVIHGAALAAALLLAACGSSSKKSVVSSRSYKGHENERDTTNLVSAYPALVGTRLDDCQTCHKSFTFSYLSGSTTRYATKNACDYCHLTQHPDTASGFIEAQPTSFTDTLNAYGLAYLAAGRSVDGLRSIDGADSDGDGAANGVEIAGQKYPGDAASQPGQPNAPTRILSLAELRAMPAHSEFLLANSTKQQFDEYATYAGVTLRALLTAVGVNPDDPGVTGVTVIAPDGFMKDVSIADVNRQFPAAKYHAGLDVATLGANCGFVIYPATLPAGLVDGGDVPGEQRILLAYGRDGAALDTSNLDPTSGKINGEGPYRLVIPQATPGRPDRGSQFNRPECSDNFVSTADHNAGNMVRGVIAVRVNPLPAGVEDFDAKNGGWAYVEDGTVVVYGHGIQ
jgi:hypothetical protein